MQNLINSISSMGWSQILILLAAAFSLFMLIRTMSKNPLSPPGTYRVGKSIIAYPLKTTNLSLLPVNQSIIILDKNKNGWIGQNIEDYQIGMSTNIFEKTFYLTDLRDFKLEKLKTYRMSPDRKLVQVSMFITEDVIFG